MLPPTEPDRSMVLGILLILMLSGLVLALLVGVPSGVLGGKIAVVAAQRSPGRRVRRWRWCGGILGALTGVAVSSLVAGGLALVDALTLRATALAWGGAPVGPLILWATLARVRRSSPASPAEGEPACFGIAPLGPNRLEPPPEFFGSIAEVPNLGPAPR